MHDNTDLFNKLLLLNLMATVKLEDTVGTTINQKKIGNDEAANAEMLYHCSNEIEKYHCEKCSDFQTSMLASLNIHIRDGHRNKNLNEDVYKCLKCFFVTYSKYIMAQHSSFSDCATRDKEEREKRFVGHKIVQSESGILFQKERENSHKSKQSLIQIKLNEKSCQLTTDNWWYCEECPYKSKYKADLRKHITSCHTKPEDIQWFECQHCSSKFKQKGSLRLHILYRHSKSEDIQWFTCNHCPSKFKRNGGLKRHIESRHSKPEDTKYACHYCASKFKLEEYLKRHIKSHHSKPEDIQWFTCPHCSSKFKQKSNLKYHITSRHSEPKDIQWITCEHCSSKFKLKHQLEQHIICRHAKPEEIRWFPCNHCSLKFKLKVYLKRHMKSHHSELEDVK